jgi:eukaryotic-like serine/threonine-protein kinase
MAEPQDRSSGWIGSVLADKWRVDAKIARGGVATVYRATHRQGQVAAIKIMHPELARNEEVRKRFLREGYAANKVGHPGVVSVLDDDVTKDGTAYIVMELLEQGEVLEDRRERLGGKLPMAEAVDVCVQILDVLAVAHDKGIIHRDIKPENIFVLEGGTVKVLDFGIAHIKEAAKQHEATATGLLLGTPEYMSPEQVLGKRGQIDASTDIYAVGATLFTLLSGESVHPAESLNMLLVLAASRQARSLASVAFKELPRPLIAVVDKALALEKHRRWPSARAMQVALRDAVPAPKVAKVSAPPPAKAPASLPPRPASLPPRPTLPPPPRASVKAKPAAPVAVEPIAAPESVPTLSNPPSTVPNPPRTESVPPPSLPPLSGPTTVIPRHAETSDPWTDELGDDLDGPTVATTGGPPGGAPAPSVRSEVLARTPRLSSPPAAPSPPVDRADLDETQQLLRTDERMALAQARTVQLPPQPSSGAIPSYMPPPPAPLPAPSWMPPRGHTMPMINSPMQPLPPEREPIALAMKIALAVAALLLAVVWIGSCQFFQSN